MQCCDYAQEGNGACNMMMGDGRSPHHWRQYDSSRRAVPLPTAAFGQTVARVGERSKKPRRS